VICPDCKEAYQASETEQAYFDNIPERPGDGRIMLYRGKGCDKCSGKGYVGRTGIFELLAVDDAIRELITKRPEAQKLKNAALESGMQTLRTDGFEKVLRGITTIEEVLRVTQEDIAGA
jgi:type II secretory ATPase GspE/PulE/Tfp pilus assembly ATPase PilB-like protein